MTSPMVEINFKEQEEEEQFMCKSDCSDNDDESFDKGTQNNSRPVGPFTQRLKLMSAGSPQKRGGLAEACKSMYSEIKRTLKRAPSGEKPKKLTEANDYMDESGNAYDTAAENENSTAYERTTTTKNVVRMNSHNRPESESALPDPPSLARPQQQAIIDSASDESADGILINRTKPGVRPQLSTRTSSTSEAERAKLGFRQRTNNNSSKIPPPPSPPSDDEMNIPRNSNNRTPLRQKSSRNLGNPRVNRTDRPLNMETPIRPPSYSDDEDDDGLESLNGASFMRNVHAADISAIHPRQNNTPSSNIYSEEDSASTARRQNDDSNASPQQPRANWIANKLDDTLHGKIAAYKWNCSQVTEFLEACGLGLYSHIFAENGVDGPILLELTNDQIRRGLNIHDKMHLLSLELAVDYLRQRKIKVVKDWDWSCPKVSEWLEAKGLGMLVNSFKLSAVHGGVLFSLTEDQFVNDLGVDKNSVLVLLSLLACIERAREVGPLASGDDVPDWSPARVKTWLEGLSLAHLVPVFRQHAVNGALLLYLDAQTMRTEMGVTEIQSIVLEKAILKLRKQQTRRAKFWKTIWRKLSGLWRAKDRAISTVRKVNTNVFSQGTLASLTATYGKYKGYRSANLTPHKNIHKLIKDSAARSSPQQQQQQFDPRAVRTPVKKTSANSRETAMKRATSMTSQNPVSPAPNRPPRPTQSSGSMSNLRQTQSSERQNGGVRFVQSKSQSNLVGENQDTNSMSIQ